LAALSVSGCKSAAGGGAGLAPYRSFLPVALPAAGLLARPRLAGFPPPPGRNFNNVAHELSRSEIKPTALLAALLKLKALYRRSL